MNEIDLKGRRAVISGGAQGIGRAIAERLLASGAAVSLWDRDAALPSETVRELSGKGRVHAAEADVADAQSVEEAAQRAVDALGGIDILVANAGITGPNRKLWEYSPDTWSHVMDVNLNGVFLCCRAVVPIMMRQNYGRIVAVSSIAGKEGNPDASAYRARESTVRAVPISPVAKSFVLGQTVRKRLIFLKWP